MNAPLHTLRAGSPWVFAVVALGLGSACEKTTPITAETEAGASGHSGADAGADAKVERDSGADAKPEDLGCPSGLPGAALVRVQTKDGHVFCMDAREVSWREYETFLGAKQGDVSGQPPECAWNERFEPVYYGPMHPEPDSTMCEERFRPVSKETAANCMDFCDAHAYCAWAGKRLCGSVGGSNSGVNDYGKLGLEPASPQMEWGYACTQGGATAYPYGEDYVAGRCVDMEWVAQGAAGALDITSLEGRSCHGEASPFDQIHDLIGNVGEWSNLCRGDVNGFSCMTAGGASTKVEPRQPCAGNAGTTYARSANPSRGLRCCADAEVGRSASD